MSAVGMGGNYISDGSLMEWLAEQQNRIYGDLRKSMDLSETRADFTEELTTIKAHLQEASGSKNRDFSKVDAELQAFMDKYGSNPDFAKLCEDIGDIASRVHEDIESQASTYARDCAVYESMHNAYLEQQALIKNDPTLEVKLEDTGSLLRDPQKPVEPAGHEYTDGELKGWDETIGAKTDKASKNDQLTMIHIQELKATLDQGSQLASTFISSGDKTNSSIINNIA
jgi:hypothetical protein